MEWLIARPNLRSRRERQEWAKPHRFFHTNCDSFRFSHSRVERNMLNLLYVCAFTSASYAEYVYDMLLRHESCVGQPLAE